MSSKEYEKLFNRVIEKYVQKNKFLLPYIHTYGNLIAPYIIERDRAGSPEKLFNQFLSKKVEFKQTYGEDASLCSVVKIPAITNDGLSIFTFCPEEFEQYLSGFCKKTVKDFENALDDYLKFELVVRCFNKKFEKALKEVFGDKKDIFLRLFNSYISIYVLEGSIKTLEKMREYVKSQEINKMINDLREKKKEKIKEVVKLARYLLKED